jgi:hypothetical protein
MEIRLFNPATGEITVEEVPDVFPDLEELRSQKLKSAYGTIQISYYYRFLLPSYR